MPARPVQPVYVRQDAAPDGRGSAHQTSYNQPRTRETESLQPSRGSPPQAALAWDRANMEAELLRLERQNLSLLRALDREEHCRDEIEQLFWHDDQAGKIVNPEAFINSKVTILEDKNKKLQQDLDRTKINLEKTKKLLKDGGNQDGKESTNLDLMEENAALAAARNQVEAEFRDWKVHENAVKAQLLSTTRRLENRCTDLEKQLASRGIRESDRGANRVGNSIDDLQSYVAHVHIVNTQMQDRIDRLTGLLMEERQARRAAQETTRALQRSLEDITAQTDLVVRDSRLEEYLASLHSQMNALRDTVILLKNDNDELCYQRGQIQTEKELAVDRAMREMKKQEQQFLTEMRTKQLEIESMQREREEISPGDEIDQVQNLKERLREREESITLLQSRLESTSQVSQQWVSKLPSAQRAVQDIDKKVIVLSKELDSERKRVLEVEQALHDLQTSKSGINPVKAPNGQSGPKEAKSRIRELEDLVEALKRGMNNVEHDLEEQNVHTRILQDKHQMAIKELEMELELLRARSSQRPSSSAAEIRNREEEEDSYRDSTMRFVSGRSMQLEARVAVLEGEKRELRARLEAMEEERERMELVLDEAARDIARRERQQLEQEEAWVGARVAEATAKVVALEERLRDSDEEKLRRAAEASRLKEELATMKQWQRQLEASLETEKANGKGMAAVSDMLRQAEQRSEDLERRLHDSNQELLEQKRTLSSVMAMKRQSDALLEDAQAEKKQLEATLLDLRAETNSARDAVTTIKQKCRLLEKAKTDLETEVSDLSVRLLKSEGENTAEAQRQILHLKETVIALQADLKTREEELEETITRKLEQEATNVKAAEHVILVEKTVKELVLKLREAKAAHEQDVFSWKTTEQSLQHRITMLEQDREKKAKVNSQYASELEVLRAENRGLEFEHGVANAELQQTGERLSHSMSNKSSLELSVKQLEMALHDKHEEVDELQSQLEEAHKIMRQLQDRIEDDRLRAGGTSNIAWSKLQEVSGKEVEASDRAATLEEKLTRSEAEKKKIQNNFRAAELTWAQTTRELEGQVEELKAARKSVAEELRASKGARMEDSELVRVLQAELEAAQGREGELEDKIQELHDHLADAKRLVLQLQQELDQAGQQLEDKDLKMDQLLLDAETARNDVKKAEDSLQAMGDVAHNQQAHITLLQAEKEADLERVRDLADEELFLAKEQIASLKQELEYIQDQVRVAINTRSKEQEQALLTARLAQEQFDELREQTAAKIMPVLQQLDNAKEAKLQSEGVAAELEGLLADERSQYNKALDLIEAFKLKYESAMTLHRKVRMLAIARLLATSLSRAFCLWRAWSRQNKEKISAAVGSWRPQHRLKQIAMREWFKSHVAEQWCRGWDGKVSLKVRRQRLSRALRRWEAAAKEMARRFHAGDTLMRWNGSGLLGRVFRNWVWVRTIRTRMGAIMAKLNGSVKLRVKKMIFRSLRRHVVRMRCLRRFLTNGRKRVRRGLLGRAMDAFEKGVIAKRAWNAASLMASQQDRIGRGNMDEAFQAEMEAAQARAKAMQKRKEAIDEEQRKTEHELLEKQEMLQKTQVLAEEAALTLQAMMAENQNQRAGLAQLAEEKESIASEAALYREQAAASLLEKEALEQEVVEVAKELEAKKEELEMELQAKREELVSVREGLENELQERREELDSVKRLSDERMLNIEQHKEELAKTEGLAAEAATILKEMIDKNESLENELEVMATTVAASAKEKEDLIQAAWTRELEQGREATRLKAEVRSLEEALKSTRESEAPGKGKMEELVEKLAGADLELRGWKVMVRRVALFEWKRCRSFVVNGAKKAGRLLERKDRELAAKTFARLAIAVKEGRQSGDYTQALQEMASEMDAVKGGALDLARDLDEAVEEVRMLRESKAASDEQLEALQDRLMDTEDKYNTLQREVGALEDQIALERKQAADVGGERERLDSRLRMMQEGQDALAQELEDATSERDAALAALETLRAQVLGMNNAPEMLA